MEKQNTAVSPPMSASDFPDSATGPIAIRMTNDYLFRALLQRSNKALKGLIGSLLRMNPEQIQSAVITNPIELGESIDEKTFILDVKVILNKNVIINLEMQVLNEYNWPERSLSYLCRAFSNLNSGEDYSKVKPVVQIGLLDFTLFPKYPEFYATYQFLNTKNHTVYSDKLRLSVLDLTRMELATEEDRLHHTDKWAALFKATAWEEIRMYTQTDEYIQEAASTIYQLTQEERIRQQCEARDDYYRRQRSVQHYIEEQAEQISEQNSFIASLEATVRQNNSIIQEKEAALRESNSIILEKEAALKERDSIIARLQAEVESLKR